MIFVFKETIFVSKETIFVSKETIFVPTWHGKEFLFLA